MLLREAFNILGVQPGIGVDEVRSRYRLLVKELHPDVHSGTGEELARIIEAYRLLDTKYYGSLVPRKKNKKPMRRTRTAESPRTTTQTTQRSRTGATSGKSSRESTRAQAEKRPTTAEVAFTLGKIAVSDPNQRRRCQALERLADIGLRSAGVFIKQCIFDTDPVVAVAAARAFPRVPGSRGENVLIELFDQLTTAQCVAVIDSIERYGLELRRFLAYAAADSRVSVRVRAMEVLRG